MSVLQGKEQNGPLICREREQTPNYEERKIPKHVWLISRRLKQIPQGSTCINKLKNVSRKGNTKEEA